MWQLMGRSQRWRETPEWQELLEMHCIRIGSEHIPCFRVVNAKGKLAGAFAFGGEDVQAELLRADGVEVINGRVNLEKYGIKAASGRLQRFERHVG